MGELVDATVAVGGIVAAELGAKVAVGSGDGSDRATGAHATKSRTVAIRTRTRRR
jgi:hypothetical protein